MVTKHHGTKGTHLIREEIAVHGAQTHLGGNIPLVGAAVEIPQRGGQLHRTGRQILNRLSLITVSVLTQRHRRNRTRLHTHHTGTLNQLHASSLRELLTVTKRRQLHAQSSRLAVRRRNLTQRIQQGGTNTLTAVVSRDLHIGPQTRRMQQRSHHSTRSHRHTRNSHHQGAAKRRVRIRAEKATLALLNLIAGRVPNLKQGKVITLLPGANLKFFAEAFSHIRAPFLRSLQSCQSV